MMAHNGLQLDLLAEIFRPKDADLLGPGGFGAVLARAGVGKTSFLVQMAIQALLRRKKVLHISVTDPVGKVTLWYKEVFHLLTQSHQKEDLQALWEAILPYRFIMTFKVEGFSVPKLEERLNDLVGQGIFKPDTMIIDGLPFADPNEQDLLALKALARAQGLNIWFTIKTHRHEEYSANKLPERIQPLSDMFQVIILLQPDGKMVHVQVLKSDAHPAEAPSLILDPATLLVTDRIQ